ncbi:MAG: FAD-dependent oxidoreductase [Rikenellaceae bacterium]
MNRKEFLKIMGLSTVAVATSGVLSACQEEKKVGAMSSGCWMNSSNDDWKYLGSRDIKTINKDQKYKFDVAVIGGGIAGISAAVAAARHGAKVVLVQNRSVLGGNASSEVHVPVNGSYHFKNKFKVDRETGIVEEIQLENIYYNPQMSWEVWDHVMYDYVTRNKNITLMLETHAIEAVMDGNKIKKAICFQQATESRVTIESDIFIDCSGDGQLAASAGAEYRYGREGKAEFGEKYAPDKPDGWVMGDSIQLSTKDMGRPVKFNPPTFAIKYDPSKMNKRGISQLNCGFWWVELSSDLDVVLDTNENRHKLLAYLYGAWDYVKNSGAYPEAENLALDWVGSTIGRRESRRFMGDYILKESDLTEYKHFDDAIAYAGGWSLDEHCPGGIENPDDPASFFHQNFTKMTEIPYRCLYSKNIANLFFAGRNYSATHIALSGTRLIAMCGMMGQAAGTAATICLAKGVSPRGVYEQYINELQETLLRDDMYIPHRPAADNLDLARNAKISASSTSSGDVKLLTDGYSRDEVDKIHHWTSKDRTPTLTMEWDEEIEISELHLKCDSSINREIQIHPNTDKFKGRPDGMPIEMVKALKVEANIDGRWIEMSRHNDNLHRLIKLGFERVVTKSIRVKFEESYGAPNIKIFEVRCYR